MTRCGNGCQPQLHCWTTRASSERIFIARKREESMDTPQDCGPQADPSTSEPERQHDGFAGWRASAYVRLHGFGTDMLSSSLI